MGTCPPFCRWVRNSRQWPARGEGTFIICSLGCCLRCSNINYLVEPANTISSKIQQCTYNAWSVNRGLERHLKTSYEIGSGLKGKVGGLTSAESKGVVRAPSQGDSPASIAVKLTTSTSTLFALPRTRWVIWWMSSGATSLHFRVGFRTGAFPLFSCHCGETTKLTFIPGT